MHVTNLNHQQKMVDTYMNASSNGDSNSSSSLANPGTVYQETLQANRRMDLADAAGQGLSSDQSIEENAQARRDAARENAVGVAGLNQQQKMVDTYMNASSSGNSGSSSSLANPGTVYQETLQANRRMDLADAVGQGLSSDQSIEENAQARRDAARENAVGVAGLNQQQKMVDTYMNASSSGNSGSSSSVANAGTVYQETLQYNRRTDLISAFERAADPRDRDSQISLFS